MNRRQVLFGAGATTIALGGATPWSAFANPGGAPASMGLFIPFNFGLRGTYSLNGSVSLVGSIPRLVSSLSPPTASLPAVQDGAVQASTPAATVAAPVAASVEPVPAAPQYSAPARAPRMSIVRVSRGGGTLH